MVLHVQNDNGIKNDSFFNLYFYTYYMQTQKQ